MLDRKAWIQSVGNRGRGGLPQEITDAMYADYLRLKSLSKVAELWGRSRQAVWGILSIRYKLRPRVVREHEPVIYKGRKFTPGKNGYLRPTDTRTRRGEALHQLIWIEANGPIPPGHHVRFIDGDKRNFDLTNLECLPLAEVSRRTATGENQFTKKRSADLVVGIERYILKHAHAIAMKTGASVEDLAQAGRIHALRYAPRYKPERGASFLGYIAIGLKGRMQRAARESTNTVHLPERRKGFLGYVSMDAPVGEEEDGATYGDVFMGSDETVHESAETSERAAMLQKVLARLPKLEREIIRLRFVEELSLEQVGAKFGLSKQRIHQIESQSLATLRRSRNLKHLKAA